MISQEVQTLSCLLAGQTGLIGQFPNTRPRKINFVLDDGAPLRLIGFQSCHESIITEFGQKKVAGFAKGRGEKLNPRENWQDLTESANAVLFTKKGRGYEVEVLKRVTSPTAKSNGVLTVCFRRTDRTDRFIPCRG